MKRFIKKTDRSLYLVPMIAIVLLFFTSARGQSGLEYFTTVSNTGETRPVIIDTVEINGVSLILETGDEIGIFDDTLCVGALKVTHIPDSLNPLNSFYIRQVEGPFTLPGAVPGDSMLFKIWHKSTGDVMEAVARFKIGENFEDPYTRIEFLDADVRRITLKTDPVIANYYIDGKSYSGQKTFYLLQGYTYQIAADSLPYISGLNEGYRYRFLDWSNAVTDSSQQYTVNGHETVIASYREQCFLTTFEDPAAGGTISPASPPGMWFDKALYGTDYDTLTVRAGSGWRFINWSGYDYSTEDTIAILMDNPNQITAHFRKEVNVTIGTNPEGLVYTINDTLVLDTTRTFSWLRGERYKLSAAGIQTDDASPTDTQYVFLNWSDGGDPTHDFIVPFPIDTTLDDTTLIVNYQTQFLLDLIPDPDENDLDFNFYGGGWINAHTTVTFGILDTIWNVNDTTRYEFLNWTGSGAGRYQGPNTDPTVTLHNPITQTAHFNKQYKLDVISDPSYTVLQNHLHGTGWFDVGDSAAFSIDQTVVNSEDTTRYTFTGWAGSGGADAYSGTATSKKVQMNHPITETADWSWQYHLAVTIDPVDSGSVTLDPDTTWFDPDSTVELSANPNPGYQWRYWSGDIEGGTNPDTLTMDGPKAVTTHFKQEVQVTVMTDPEGLTYTINDTLALDSTRTFTWVVGDTHFVEIEDIQAGGVDTQFVFTSWNREAISDTLFQYIVQNPDDTLKISFKTQYFLTFNGIAFPDSVPVDTLKKQMESEGWYDADQNIIVSLLTENLVTKEDSTRFVFRDWTVLKDDTVTYEALPALTMARPMTILSNWMEQHHLTLTSVPVADTLLSVMDGGGWYTKHDTAEVILSDTIVFVENAARYFFTNWSGDAAVTNDTLYEVVMDTFATQVSHWEAQYYLDMTVSPEESGTVTLIPPGNWYAGGDTVEMLAVPNAAYLFARWDGDHFSSINPDTIIMNRAKTCIAFFGERTDVTIETVPSGLTFYADSVVYTAPQAFQWISGSIHLLSADSIQAIAADRRNRFVSWTYRSVTQYSQEFQYVVPEESETVTANYQKQFLLTLESDPGAVTVPLIGGGWYDADANAVFRISSRIESLGAGSRYRFLRWQGTAYTGEDSLRIVTMDTSITETAVWQKEHYLNLIADPGTAAQTGWAKNIGWYTEGTQAKFWVDSTSLQIGSGSKHFFVRWEGIGTGSYYGSEDTATVTMNNPITEEAVWSHRYKLFLTEYPDEGGYVQITANPSGYADNWYDSGSLMILHAHPNTGADFRWLKWEGDVPPSSPNPVTFTMDTAKVISVYFEKDVEITVMTDPPGLTFKVNNTTYSSSHQFSWTGWQEYAVSADSPQNTVLNQTRYRFYGWSDGGLRSHTYIVPTSDDTLTAIFKRQFYLNVLSNYDTPYGTGWYDTTAVATFGVQVEEVSGGTGPPFVFTGWTGTGNGSYTGPNREAYVSMNNPITELANWTTKDTQAPQLTEQFPVDEAQQVPINNNLEFKIIDDFHPVNTESLNVIVLGDTIIKYGVPQPQFGSIYWFIHSGGVLHHIGFNPNDNFSVNSDVIVTVSCADQAKTPNNMLESYSFKTGTSTIQVTTDSTVYLTGATLTDASTGLVLIIPPNALYYPTKITMGILGNPPSLPDTLKSIGPTYHFGPDGLLFQSPVTVIAPLDSAWLTDAGVFDFSYIRVFSFSTTSGTWDEILNPVIDPAAMTVTFQMSRFNFITLGAWQQTMSAIPWDGFARVFNYPNPFNPDLNAAVIRYQVSKVATLSIKLYDVSGLLVKELEKDKSCAKLTDYECQWDGRNTNGDIVANNVYFCVIESKSGDRTVHKIAVLR